MLLGVEFPPTSAEWTFFVAAAVILLGPLLRDRAALRLAICKLVLPREDPLRRRFGRGAWLPVGTE